MSAYLVSAKQIGLITAFAFKNDCTKYGPLHGKDLESIDNIAKMFAEANIESIEYRYPDTKGRAAIDFQSMTNAEYIESSIKEAEQCNLTQYTPAQIAKIISNYDYQSCETDSWYESLAYKALGVMRQHLVGHLPGYNQADWGL
jgi:hypothetical protein